MLDKGGWKQEVGRLTRRPASVLKILAGSTDMPCVRQDGTPLTAQEGSVRLGSSI